MNYTNLRLNADSYYHDSCVTNEYYSYPAQETASA